MRRLQRGFLYLTTGANGVGKTLFSLKEVHERAQKESRPVCYNGRFDLDPTGPLAYWKKIDMKDWQAEPDGTIFFVDEAHNDYPAGRSVREPMPEFIRMMAEHRKRGFDFYLITQHPQNLDVFVRRLIGNPGWHRHFKRTFGADLVSQLEWAAVNPNCEKPGSGESGVVTMRPFPKEVYTWYKSAQLHTGKTKIPRFIFWAIGAFLLVPVCGYFAFTVLMKPKAIAARVLGREVASGAPGVPGQGAPAAAAAGRSVLTVQEYLAGYAPRLEGFPQSAPVYDSVTQPVTAPYPAACVAGFNRRLGKSTCVCYSQQATLLQVPTPLCREIVERGYFIDWAQDKPSDSAGARPVAVAAGPADVALVPKPSMSAQELPRPAIGIQDGAAIGAMRTGSRRW